MAKFYGIVGFVETTETSPGVWTDQETERNYYGDVLRNTMKMKPGTGLNDNLTVSNRISITADPYANETFFAIRYVVWMGVKWKVTDVDVQRPRLILSIGGVYNE
jgi:hypothetical protein